MFFGLNIGRRESKANASGPPKNCENAIVWGLGRVDLVHRLDFADSGCPSLRSANRLGSSTSS